MNGIGWHHIPCLVREQAEDRATQECNGAFFDDADTAVAVLHRARKIARLKGGAHALDLAGRHFAAINQGLGAAADAAVQGAHLYLIGSRLGKRLGAQLGEAWFDQPAGLGRERRHGLWGRGTRGRMLGFSCPLRTAPSCAGPADASIR